jgi:hypothetical protein
MALAKSTGVHPAKEGSRQSWSPSMNAALSCFLFNALNGWGGQNRGNLNGLAHPSGNVICDGDEPGFD